MAPKNNFDRWLGLLFCAFALVMIFVWVPLDTETGIVETVRRKAVIGDALGPTVAGVVLLLGAILTLLRPGMSGLGLTWQNVIWMGKLLVLFALATTLMRYTGPLLGAFVEGGYRPLRAQVPWKYAGFLTGGTVLVAGAIALARGRLTLPDLLLGLVCALVFALAYDLPFDDLLLPPNGDV